MTKDLSEIQENHFDIKYCSFWEEHIFLSDHKDSPKVIFSYFLTSNLNLIIQDWKSIRTCLLKGLESIRMHHNRRFSRAFHVTDTGGENWGTQVILSIFLLCLTFIPTICIPGSSFVFMEHGGFSAAVSLVSNPSKPFRYKLAVLRGGK